MMSRVITVPLYLFFPDRTEEDPMANEPRTTNIPDELNKMGKLISQAVEAAWESEERKRLETEIVEGLRKISDEFSTAAKKASQSESVQQIKTQAEKVAVEMKERDIVEDVRKGLLSGLAIVNEELGKLVERLEVKQPPTAPPAPEAPAAPEAPVAPEAPEPPTAPPAPEAPQEV
jgi:hypothetical protein